MAIFAALFFPAAAHAAAPVPVGPPGSSEGALAIAVAGDRVVWTASPERFGQPFDVLGATAGGPVERLLRPPPPRDPAGEQLGDLDASARWVVLVHNDFVRTEYTVHTRGSGVWAGRQGAPLERRDIVPSGYAPSTVALDRGRLALLTYELEETRASRPRLVLHDLDTGATRARTLSRHASLPLALRGRWIATASQVGDRDITQVTVRDVRTWRARTRVEIGEDAIDVDLALRADGTLAIGAGAYVPSRLRAFVVPLGARRVRRVRVRPRAPDVAWAGRRLILEERLRGGTRLVVASTRRPPQPITGRIRRLFTFDAEGTRVAWRTPACVYTATLADRALDAPAPGCPQAPPG